MKLERVDKCDGIAEPIHNTQLAIMSIARETGLLASFVQDQLRKGNQFHGGAFTIIRRVPEGRYA